MSVRVTDPNGIEWAISREWFGLPAWARWRRRRTPDSAAVDGDEPLAVVASLATLSVLLVFVAILLPLTLLFLGAIAGLIALVARITSVSTWTVRAESADRLLEWRVRGLTRSRR